MPEIETMGSSNRQTATKYITNLVRDVTSIRHTIMAMQPTAIKITSNALFHIKTLRLISICLLKLSSFNLWHLPICLMLKTGIAYT